MVQPSPKILAVGAPLGDLRTLTSKIKTFQKKGGPFECCVILGDAFKPHGDGSELTSDLEFVIPTYFIHGTNPFPSNITTRILAAQGTSSGSGPVELIKNLFYLGKAGAFETSGGVRIGFLGGKSLAGDVTFDGEDVSAIISPNDLTSVLATPLFQASSLTGPPPTNVLPPRPAVTTASSAAPGSLAAARVAQEEAKLQQAAKEAAVAEANKVAKGEGSPWTKGVDLLLMAAQPPFVEQGSSTYPSGSSATGSTAALPSRPPPTTPLTDLLTEVIRLGRPRYILWSVGPDTETKNAEKWEREPFGWKSTGPMGKEDRFSRAVRVERLGDVEGDVGPSKRKFYYAFTLPALPSAPAKPADCTINPYARAAAPQQNGNMNGSRGLKRAAEENGENFIWGGAAVKRGRGENGSGLPSGQRPPEGYKCVKCGSVEHYVRECPEKAAPREVRMPKTLASEDCWFCLSNPKLTKELIVSIRESCYVALAKGQIIPTGRSVETGVSSRPPVPGGGHSLIIPFGHYTTHLNLPEEEALPIAMEIVEIKEGLAKTFADYDCVPVFFENVRPHFGHGHIQVVPVPKAKAGAVEAAFRDAAAESGIAWEADPSSVLKRGSVQDCFKVDLPDGKQLVHITRKGFNFQFGRLVLAGLLGVADRADWHQCMETSEEAREDKVNFTAAILKHLPDIDDD